ncbi:STAS/SEC14 domain-containing protein [Pseudonocardia spirodelae]|uniref:STAS/SEC14 domain-containing protein n=1 Tax=Pseudonocardia spirodelae TaxID=3133431 RepID=A0ABU8T443_9PSEU
MTRAPGTTPVRARPGGVVRLDLDGPVRACDYDDLDEAVERSRAAGVSRPALVVSAPAFAGWDGPAALLRHQLFVLERHDALRRVALVLGGLPPAVHELAELLLPPAVRLFAPRDLDAALCWAAAPGPVVEGL